MSSCDHWYSEGNEIMFLSAGRSGSSRGALSFTFELAISGLGWALLSTIFFLKKGKKWFMNLGLSQKIVG